MNPDVEALLVVQHHDGIVRAIEARRDAFAPRLQVLDQVRAQARAEVMRIAAHYEKEMAQAKALEAKVAECKARHARNQAVMDQAHKLKEATAALAQVETGRRVLAEAESEWLAATRRLTDLRASGRAAQEMILLIDDDQAAERAAIAADQSTIDGELAAARAARQAVTGAVSPSMLARYDRLQQRRRDNALFALTPHYTCGACDTAIPLQRRPLMAGGRTIEVCEGCGVLVYMPPTPTPTPTEGDAVPADAAPTDTA